jgi:hypothetical protein
VLAGLREAAQQPILIKRIHMVADEWLNVSENRSCRLFPRTEVTGDA